VATAGVAAIATLQVVGCGEDQVGTFIVEVFGAKLFAGRFHILF
jgi:hypothetical protein